MSASRASIVVASFGGLHLAAVLNETQAVDK